MKKLSSQRLATYLVAIIGSGFLIIYLRNFFAPLALAFLFALMLYPATKRLEQWRIPRGLSIFGLLLSFLITVAGIIFGISLVFRHFLRDLPALESQFQNNVANFRESLQARFGLGEQASEIITDQLQISELFNSNVIGTIVGTTTNTIVIAGFTLVFTFFMLYYREKFTHFLHSIFEKRRHKTIHEIMDQMDDIAPRYLLGIVTVVSILAVINSTGFAIIGVESPIFMGIIAAILNVIPFIGTIFGFGIVFLFTLATQSIGTAIGVLIMFVFVQFFDNNVLTPNITASKIKLNPLFAILAILLGNIIWGVLGMFVALPFLAMLKIIFDSTPHWKPIGDLLGTVKPVDTDE